MKTPVLVVGAGPVGMTMASELARYGLTVRIVDKAAQRSDKSKALVLWSRTLELLDRGGAGAAPFVDAGFKVFGLNFVAGNEVIGRVDMTGVSSRYAYALMIPQSETERLLEERLARQGVQVEREVEALGYENDVNGVQVKLRRDGQEETVAADWLIGCDGAHSIVRHASGATFSGETMKSNWMLADLHMRGYPYPNHEVAVYWHHDGVFVIFPISEGRYRVIADQPLTDEEKPPTPTLEQVQTVIKRRGPAGLTAFDPIWLAGFRINSRKVASYRWGRAFLAGDAAHVHSPAGGQGMNTGMQDAVNLAWKLAMVVHNTADERLLDSFTQERSSVGEAVLKAAGAITSVGTTKSPILQAIRNSVAHVMLGLHPVTHAMADRMSEVAIGYSHSPLNGQAALGMRPKPGERVAPLEGERPPAEGARPRFTLYAEQTTEVADLAERLTELIDPDVQPALEEGGMWLVRPDGYVACVSREVAAIERYLVDVFPRRAGLLSSEVGYSPRQTHSEPL